MIHPHTELRKIDDHIGYGVFATRDIPRGTITWALDPLDRIIDAAVLAHEDRYGGLIEHYAFTNSKGQRVLCWDFARFMNHSCDPSCAGPGGTDFDIAVRDIAAGEELTYDYGSLNIGVPLACRCGLQACRGVISAADLRARAPVVDAQLRAAFARIHQVEQPLWTWVEPARADITQWARHPETLPSATAHLYSRP